MDNKQSSNRFAMTIITTLFFAWGFITVLNDILIPHFRNIFDLSYAQSTLIQFFFFAAYFVMSWPSSFLLQRFGYKKGIVIGLGITGLGAFLFFPAANLLSYPFFLFAFFVLASGITMLQVSANPYVTELGKPEFASSRLNLAQGFNSLGTTLAPIFGSLIILGGIVFYPFYPYGSEDIIAVDDGAQSALVETYQHHPDLEAKWRETNVDEVYLDRDSNAWYLSDNGVVFAHSYLSKYAHTPAVPPQPIGVIASKEDTLLPPRFVDAAGLEAFRRQEAEHVQLPYVFIGLFLIVLAVLFFFIKLPELRYVKEARQKGSLFQFPHLISGSVAIFAYVGAEVAIGSFLVSFFMLENVAGLTELQGGFYVAFYWGGAMIGRFAGALAQRFIAPNRVLMLAALMAIVLVLMTILLSGPVAMWTVIAVGLFNSVMFPTIFSLSVKDLGAFKSKGSGLLISMIVGGAIIPYLMGLLADQMGVQLSFTLTLVCYAYILYFAVKGYKLRKSIA